MVTLFDGCRLLESKAQESFYNKIVARYMQFCSNHSKDLDSAFASLSVEDSTTSSLESPLTAHVAHTPQGSRFPITASLPEGVSSSVQGLNPSLPSPQPPPPPSRELVIILLALRKLREALLATSSSAISPVFSQRVHVFSIRLAILAFHPPSYHPPLIHLLFVLHTSQFPLPNSELSEMTTYLILDLACRQQDMASAFCLRSSSRLHQGYKSSIVNEILGAIVINNWVAFWRVRRKVDGYVRALMQWIVPSLRRNCLKALGRSYLNCDIKWILQSATGAETSWEELAEKENIGWIVDGSKVIIRKPKLKNIS